MRIYFAFAAALLLTIVSRADVVTSASCSVSNPVPPAYSQTSNSNPCSLTVGGGTVNASSTGTLIGPVAGSPTLAVGGNLTADGVAIPVGPAQSAQASATASASLTLFTAGPIRPGFLSFSYYVSTGADFGITDFGSALVNVQVGPLFLNCSPTVPPINTGCLGYYGPSGNAGTVLLPITLGQAFTFSETASVDTGIVTSVFPKGDNALADVSFTLFEADGTTPVQMFAAPEPGTLALLGGGLLALLEARRRAASRTRDML